MVGHSWLLEKSFEYEEFVSNLCCYLRYIMMNLSMHKSVTTFVLFSQDKYTKI